MYVVQILLTCRAIARLESSASWEAEIGKIRWFPRFCGFLHPPKIFIMFIMGEGFTSCAARVKLHHIVYRFHSAFTSIIFWSMEEKAPNNSAIVYTVGFLTVRATPEWTFDICIFGSIQMMCYCLVCSGSRTSSLHGKTKLGLKKTSFKVTMNNSHLNGTSIDFVRLNLLSQETDFHPASIGESNDPDCSATI